MGFFSLRFCVCVLGGVGFALDFRSVGGARSVRAVWGVAGSSRFFSRFAVFSFLVDVYVSGIDVF